MCAHRAAVLRLVVTTCLNPPSQQEHTRLLSSVCATSTGDKRSNPQHYFQPSLKTENVTCLQIAHGP